MKPIRLAVLHQKLLCLLANSQVNNRRVNIVHCPEPLTNSLNTPITGPQDNPTEDNIIQLETNDNSHNTVIGHDNDQDT